MIPDRRQRSIDHRSESFTRREIEMIRMSPPSVVVIL